MLSTQTLHMMEMGKTTIRNLAATKKPIFRFFHHTTPQNANKWKMEMGHLFLGGVWTNPFEKYACQIG